MRFPKVSKYRPKPFKFSNVLVHHDKFKETVAEGWSLEVTGHPIFRVVQKLKSLKKPFRKLLYDKGNLHERVTKLRAKLDEV
ncbi:MAG TPA: hypothetical protein VFI70_11810 [Nitrososphaeraceae archaeon]|nr:hypothetical protein [Nitrososphaeraceae archaeon]